MQLENRPLTWADGSPITAYGQPVYAFQATPEQFADSSLFNTPYLGNQGSASWANVVKAVQQYGQEQANAHSGEIGSFKGQEDSQGYIRDALGNIVSDHVIRDTTIEETVLAGGPAGKATTTAGKVAKDLGEAILGWVEGKLAGEGAKATGGGVDRAITGIEWGKGIQGQGMPWEDYLGTQLPVGSRLPPNFNTFDFFDETTGIATSAKTLDTTTAAKIANPRQVYSSLKGNIDAVANFSEAGLKGVTVTSSKITARELQVAIPDVTTSAQWEQINRAIEYGQSKGVTVKITKVN
ncbi:hypothetical protein [Pseudomonas citronellolis]|uniref:endonuclease toxin domain-containing protein n=1 Tax=Pseudomonas citronellolis TaxID=53408 RepID=UPI0023E39D10|nr:hypothetical protein [Pseudomonas citronellolis]MDF3931346.1 hypothetical protein [Pseudomonas citronellolis]